VRQAESGEPTVDAFLGGLVTLMQPARGHRAGHDAALLQAIVPATARGLAVDLGAGVGTVAFCAAARAPALDVVGVERDAGLVGLGCGALALPQNAGFAARVRLVEADVIDPELSARTAIAGGAADFVLMNPPFDSPARSRGSPDAKRRDAHVAEPGLLGEWCSVAARLLKRGGVLGVIHRADALADVLAALAGKFGETRILPVHPAGNADAIRIVVRARAGSRAPDGIAPGLVLHAANGAPTPQAEAILRGRAELSFVARG
jgi:tRNA1(Val) A37 N6-methylase TrmN6